jgi:hypothetical protein
MAVMKKRRMIDKKREQNCKEIDGRDYNLR